MTIVATHPATSRGYESPNTDGEYSITGDGVNEEGVIARYFSEIDFNPEIEFDPSCPYKDKYILRLLISRHILDQQAHFHRKMTPSGATNLNRAYASTHGVMHFIEIKKGHWYDEFYEFNNFCVDTETADDDKKLRVPKSFLVHLGRHGPISEVEEQLFKADLDMTKLYLFADILQQMTTYKEKGKLKMPRLLVNYPIVRMIMTKTLAKGLEDILATPDLPSPEEIRCVDPRLLA